MPCAKVTLGVSLQGFQPEDGERKLAKDSNDKGPLIYTKLLRKARKTIVVTVKRTSFSDFRSLQQYPVPPLSRVSSPLPLLQNHALLFSMGM